MTLRLYTILR